VIVPRLRLSLASTLMCPILASAVLAEVRLVPGEYSTIQAAIDDCNDGDTVVVAPGTYTGNGNRDIDFRGKAITVRGSDPNDLNVVAATIIDCNGTDEEPHRGFRFNSGEGPESVVAGLTITNGYGPNEPLEYRYSVGGGIFCGGSDPTITRCRIIGNAAQGYGGGICTHNSSATISYCLLVENSTCYGGAISCFESGPTITHCTVIGNSASSDGGGIHCYREGSNPIMSHCTISGNSSYTGGAICCDADSEPTMSHCILWGNAGLGRDDEISVFDHSQLTVSYSDIRGGQEAVYLGKATLNWSVENIEVDPCFVSPGVGDYRLHLASDSPCINAGDPAFIGTAEETDIDGEPRVIDGRVDIGADEFNPATPSFGISAAEIEFLSDIGDANPEAQHLSIRNMGGETLNWAIIYDCNWLQVHPDSGSTAGSVSPVTLAADITGLARGDYNCELTISDPCALNSPQSVRVNLFIHAPIIELSSPEFEFAALEGGPNPAGQVLSVRNAGLKTLEWTISEDCDWLQVNPSAGRCSRGEANDVTLSVDITGLTRDEYSCQLIISDPLAENSPQVVQVRLFIPCFPSEPEYAQQYADFLAYITHGADPTCWCRWPYGSGFQCDGDADGMRQGFASMRVMTNDLVMLILNWKRKIDTADPCADLDHKAQGFQGYRVFTNDLAILLANWKKKDRDLARDCPRPDGQ